MPAIAGPINRARLNTTELIASAEASDSRPTNVGIKARREGCATPLAMPSISTRANRISIVIASVTTKIANRHACAQPIHWVMRIVQTRSRRSASTPAKGARNRTGRKSASEINPSQAPEWVKVQVSQPTATRSSHQPISEMLLPMT